MYCKEEQSDSERNNFLPFCLGGVTVQTIEIEIVRSGSRKDLKMELNIQLQSWGVNQND